MSTKPSSGRERDAVASPASRRDGKGGYDQVEVAPLRHPGRWLAAGVVLILGAMFANTLLTNPRCEWGVVGDYFFSRPVLLGVMRTLQLTVIAMSISVVLGIVAAVMRLSPNPHVSGASFGYTWLFRGTPLLVQLIFWFNLSALYRRISIGVPFGPELFGGSANVIITPWVAALLGLSLNAGVYMAEIVRGGILSVGEGQTRAAKALAGIATPIRASLPTRRSACKLLASWSCTTRFAHRASSCR